MKWFRMFVFGLALVASFASASYAADAEAIATASRKLHLGAFGDSPVALIEARAQFERLAAAEPNSALLQYSVALADWRLVPRLDDDKKKAKQFCVDGIERCDRALALDPEFAEAMALKAGLQGMSIQFNPLSGMTLGPEMEKNTKRALELAPENPRVHFLDALNTLHKPEFIGGGAKKASAKFATALELFEKEIAAADADEAPNGATLRWGHKMSFIWAGRTALKLDDPQGSAGFLQRALAVNPENGWVRGVLLPEAETKLKGKDKS